MYSVVLTKAAVLDKSFLYSYRDVIPQDFLTFIDEHRNCEDLAMAYLVSLKVRPTYSCLYIEHSLNG